MSEIIATVRPPWPDELTRLADAFPGLALTGPLHLRVLVVPATAANPERLVGVAALAAPAEGKTDAALAFAVRPRFAATRPACDLLAAIIAVAREKHFPAVITAAPADTDLLGTPLRAAGFSPGTEVGTSRLSLNT